MSRLFARLPSLTLAALMFMGSLTVTATVTATANASELRPDGIHTESWMKAMTFLDFKEDLAEAQAEGKGLVVLFEQPGCGSCKRLHEVTLQDKGLVKYVTENYVFLQINMYGDNLVTDFDGEELSEVSLAEKYLINFSPTTVFFGKDGVETFRMPGFFKPYFYQSGFEYVADEGPQKGIMFPRWLKSKRDRLAKAKIES